MCDKVDKGKEACGVSPTINDEWIKEKLVDISDNGEYSEEIIMARIEFISVYRKYLVVNGKNAEQWMIRF